MLADRSPLISHHHADQNAAGEISDLFPPLTAMELTPDSHLSSLGVLFMSVSTCLFSLL